VTFGIVVADAVWFLRYLRAAYEKFNRGKVLKRQVVRQQDACIFACIFEQDACIFVNYR
jgi:hypothetical protein